MEQKLSTSGLSLLYKKMVKELLLEKVFESMDWFVKDGNRLHSCYFTEKRRCQNYKNPMGLYISKVIIDIDIYILLNHLTYFLI